MRPSRFTSFVAAVALATAAFAPGCSGCRCSTKSDAELAAEERKKADELWRGSLAIVPWRALKGAVRSKEAPNRPEVYTKVDATLAALDAPARTTPEAEAKTRVDASLDLLGYLVVHRGELATFDEDAFPRLANVLGKTSPPAPAPWYDDPAEHLVTAFGVLALDAADTSDRVPARDIAFYELSRAPPQAAWPAELRFADRYAHGLVFLEHALYYASQEELGGYLEDVEHAADADFAHVADVLPDHATRLEPKRAARETFLAAGHLARAYDRAMLNRDEAAFEDLEAALASFERMGVENEVTLWGRALVQQRRERWDEAARLLDELAASAYLDERTKKDMRLAADDLRHRERNRTWFQRPRTHAAMLRAVLARHGGVEGLLALLVGKEKAKPFATALTSTSAKRELLRDIAASHRERLEGLAAGATERGKKTLGIDGRLHDASTP